jgi:hypothetical protein
VIKLISILKDIINEGAKATFYEGENNIQKIDISVKPIEGEQLITSNKTRKTNNYNVFIGLESTPDNKITNIKKSEDALKNNANLIEENELEKFLISNLKSRLPSIDYIGFLESTGDLNILLKKTIQKIYSIPDDKTIYIDKIKYEKIDDAVDWEQFDKESEKIKTAILNWLSKRAENPPPYTIRKSGETQSSIIQRLHSKYNVGFNPNIKNKSLPQIYNVLAECIIKGKKILIIDDNLHTGTDFLKLFRDVDKLINKLREEYSKPTEDEQKIINELEDIKKNPKFKTSQFLQSKYKELNKLKVKILERTEMITKNITGPDKVFGYVLYELKSEDLNR